MRRNRLSPLAALALLAIGSGCADTPEPSRAQATWNAMENDLVKKLTDVQTRHAELQGRLHTAAAAVMPDDTTVAASRAEVERNIAEHDARLAEVEAIVQKHGQERDRLAASGEEEKMEAAWSAARADYQNAMNTLVEIQRRTEELAGRIDSWSAAGRDTAVGGAVDDGAGGAVGSATVGENRNDTAGR